MNLTDEEFFIAHPDRQTHIRQPRVELVKCRDRSMRYMRESDHEFQMLGVHDQKRRRVILWRVPKDNEYYDPTKPQILKIPFLAFADETIEDDDATLLPILDGIMKEAAQ